VKTLRLTAHAEVAATERAIDHDWIERTAREPEWAAPDPIDPAVARRFRAIPEHGGRVLRVACVETATEIRVLTVFFDRAAKRPT
jgi:hypothetical protein